MTSSVDPESLIPLHRQGVASEQSAYSPCNFPVDRAAVVFLRHPAAAFLLRPTEGTNPLVDGQQLSVSCWRRRNSRKSLEQLSAL
jgi:hypothetical protein